MAENEEMKMETASSMPTLTFGDTFKAEEAPAAAPAAQETAAEPELNIQIDESMFNEAEMKAVEDFAKQIDIHNTKGIMEYGAGVQKKMAEFSENTLNTVRTKDMGAVGDLLANVVSEVKNFDKDNEQKGFLGIFKKAGANIEAMKTKYDKAEVNISKICDNLENHQVTLLKDVAMFDQMYELNMNSYKEVTMYIMAGQRKLTEVRNGELAELRKKAETTGKAEDAQAVRDLSDQLNRFEKKLYDLDLSRTISMQTAPQIRMLQNADTQMAEKIQSVIVNTIPLWKNQMVISLGIAHSQAAIQAENAVTNATNELLRKNAQALHTAGVEAEKANQRGIVDLDTLKQTNQELLNTLDDVMRIQQEGRQKRVEAEAELRKMEEELKSKLLEMSQK